ncbi:dnaJ homolog subfamily C member 30, mitochondrial [Lasioglossum baleicum]|uniref:dnaJ homolog subfamily C member 30, mitochondrial n=1 Tax=Lasioglossum baleicum TaxID=434251 RepID=UPI003FCE2E49
MTLSTKSKTHYDTLNVSPNATYNEIKSAYYKLTLQYHPDRNKSEEARKMFHNISDAYEVIGNFASRKKYDRSIAVKRVDIDQIQRPPTTEEYSKQHMAKIYDFDDWLRAHYGKSFAKYKARKQLYSQFLKEKEKKQRENLSMSRLLLPIAVLGFSVVGILYYTDRRIKKLDDPKRE